jgi:hypothetical protein
LVVEAGIVLGVVYQHGLPLLDSPAGDASRQRQLHADERLGVGRNHQTC